MIPASQAAVNTGIAARQNLVTIGAIAVGLGATRGVHLPYANEHAATTGNRFVTMSTPKNQRQSLSFKSNFAPYLPFLMNSWLREYHHRTTAHII